MEVLRLYPEPKPIDIGGRPDNDPPVFEAVNLYKVPQAFISSYGYVIRNLKVLKEGISFRHRNSVIFRNILSFVLLKKKRRISKPCLSIANGWDNSYYHFTPESPPKLFLLKVYMGTSVLVFPADTSPFHEQWFKILGIRNIQPVADNEIVKTPLAITTNFASRDLNHHDLVMPRFRDWVLSHINTKDAALHKKIFIGRKNPRYRILLNNPEAKEMLAESGFVYLEMEDFSVEHQVALFNYAEQIVCVHGAALTNICFCRPGTKIIDLMHEDFKQWCFLKLALVLGLDYTILPCAGPQKNGELPGHRDISVHLPALKQLIEKW